MRVGELTLSKTHLKIPKSDNSKDKFEIFISANNTHRRTINNTQIRIVNHREIVEQQICALAKAKAIMKPVAILEDPQNVHQIRVFLLKRYLSVRAANLNSAGRIQFKYRLVAGFQRNRNVHYDLDLFEDGSIHVFCRCCESKSHKAINALCESTVRLYYDGDVLKYLEQNAMGWIDVDIVNGSHQSESCVYADTEKFSQDDINRGIPVELYRTNRAEYKRKVHLMQQLRKNA